MKHSITFILLFLMFNASCFSQEVVKKRINSDSLQKYLQETIATYKIPGVQATLVTGTEILNVAAAGVIQIGGDSITIQNKMHLGSCGKAMTGYLAAVLVERKLLEWDSKIIEIFPEFKAIIHNEFLDITLQELLSHQTKVARFYTDEEWKLLERFKQKDPTKKRYNFTKWVLKQHPIPFDSLESKAGFRYSNAGYAIAAAMLEKVTARSWEQLITEEVFNPLKMDVTFGWPATNDKSQPYGHITDTITKDLIPHNPNDTYSIDPILSPAGNMSMSILDYAKFIQKNLRGLNGIDEEYPKEFYEFLHYSSKPRSEYSIGWYSIDQFNDELSAHTGSADTFYCLNLLLKKHNIAVIVIANSATETTETGTEKIRNYLIRPYLTK